MFITTTSNWHINSTYYYPNYKTVAVCIIAATITSCYTTNYYSGAYVRKSMTKVPQNLLTAQNHLFTPAQLSVSNVALEEESHDYDACHFKLNNYTIQFRSSKITPTKVGQFVTFWKRSKDGITMPHETSDQFDFLMISACCKNQFGLFIFPKKALLQYDIISENGIGGKRGFRVYPAWDITDNSQAIKTQKWQLHYFMQLQTDSAVNTARLQQLLSY